MARVARSRTADRLAGVERGGDEEPGLTEVLGRREAAGQGQVADDAVGHHALDRDVAGVGVAGPGRVVGQVTLEDHVGAGGAQGDEQLLELGTGRGPGRCSGCPGPSGA